MSDVLQYWTAWYPKAGSTGLPFARGRLDATEHLLVHAAPEVMTVEVYNEAMQRLAFGQNLESTQSSPICLLTRNDNEIAREDIWPDGSHIGLPVLLPGGEVGILKSWWHAEDQKEWRWQVEFYNSIR